MMFDFGIEDVLVWRKESRYLGMQYVYVVVMIGGKRFKFTNTTPRATGLDLPED
jgi:hypothetical protein